MYKPQKNSSFIYYLLVLLRIPTKNGATSKEFQLFSRGGMDKKDNTGIALQAFISLNTVPLLLYRLKYTII